jgi:uncharacterized membrane protein required for colicin V production
VGADLVILLTLLVGVFVGLTRGFIGPLITEGAFLVAIFITVHVHSQFDAFLPVGWLRTGFAILMVIVLTAALRFLARPLISLWRAIPPLRIVDAPLGAVAHAFAVFVLIYLGLGVVLDFDRGAYPLLKAAVGTANAIDAYRQAVQQQPLLSGLIDDKVLKQLAQQAGPSPLPMQQVRQTEGFLNFYDQYIRKPLLTSKLAPFINRMGASLPIVGRSRPYLFGAQTAVLLAGRALP